MSFFPNSKTFLSIGPLSIQWYAVLILCGALLTYLISSHNMKKNGVSQDSIDDLFLGCLGFGIIGARLWYCVFYDFEYYFSNPVHILEIYNGGLAIQGGLFFGALFAYFYCRKKKIGFLRMGDAVLPYVLLAQGIGRWGNFINQEAFGRIVSESYFDHFPAFIKNQMFIDGAYREPTFLYESVLNLLGVFLLHFVFKKYCKPKRGDMVYGYLIWYGASRFIVEAFRSDSLMFMGLKMAQLTSLAFIAFGLLGYFGLFRKLFPQPKPVVVFDLDGTLLDTEPAILETYRRLFAKYRTTDQFDREKQLSVLGPSIEEKIAEFFPEQDTKQLVEEYRKVNLQIHPTHVKPMKNCEELLTGLKAQGYHCAIVSTKLHETILVGLKQFHLEGYFDIIIGRDDVVKEKPDPEGIFKACDSIANGHDSCIYVGDSVMDIVAGKNAGVYTVGYRFNPERKEALEQAKPNRLIDDLGEILELVKEDNYWTSNLM